MSKIWKAYSKEDEKLIMDLREAGKSYWEIGHVLGRSWKAIALKYNSMKNQEKMTSLNVGGVKVGEVKAEAVEERKPVGIIAAGENAGMPVMQMTPREMIRKLYEMGYRIENNQLVCYVKQKVNMKDIISD